MLNTKIKPTKFTGKGTLTYKDLTFSKFDSFKNIRISKNISNKTLTKPKNTTYKQNKDKQTLTFKGFDCLKDLL